MMMNKNGENTRTIIMSHGGDKKKIADGDEQWWWIEMINVND